MKNENANANKNLERESILVWSLPGMVPKSKMTYFGGHVSSSGFNGCTNHRPNRTYSLLNNDRSRRLCNALNNNSRTSYSIPFLSHATTSCPKKAKIFSSPHSSSPPKKLKLLDNDPQIVFKAGGASSPYQNTHSSFSAANRRSIFVDEGDDDVDGLRRHTQSRSCFRQLLYARKIGSSQTSVTTSTSVCAAVYRHHRSPLTSV